ncbi:hypothetical protein AAFF_G00366780 [Aldrovandia affinis]|uniref:Histone chaperone domain-containing protein n=1 Tax=Aldrovandia affinis TaxID=143900 RepID=A0AAD7SHV3_9TELE|nr:hypothetical protein AAFF_G00366780 [Aldrovandia affinis]
MKHTVEDELLEMQNSDSSDNEPLIRKTVSRSPNNNKRKRDEEDEVEEEKERMGKEEVARRKKSRLATDSPVSPDSGIERVEKEGDLKEGKNGEEDGSERGGDLDSSGESLEEEKKMSQKTAMKRKDDWETSGDSEEEERKMSQKMPSKQKKKGEGLSWRKKEVTSESEEKEVTSESEEKEVTSESEGKSEEELGTLNRPKGRIHKKRDPGLDFEEGEGSEEEMEEKQVGALRRRQKKKTVESDYEEEDGPKKTTRKSRTEEMEGNSESKDQGSKRKRETLEKVSAEKKKALKNKQVRSTSESDGESGGENNRETPGKRGSKRSYKVAKAKCGSAGEGEKRQMGENGDGRKATDLSEDDKGKEERMEEAEEKKKSASGSDSDSSSLPSLEEESESESKPEQGKKMMKRKKMEERERASEGRREEEHKSVSRLKHYIALCGVRRNYKKLLEGCRSVKAKVSVLKKELEDLGVTGQPSIEKCKKARLKREEAQELAELDVSNIITTQGRPKRRGLSVWPPPKTVSPPPSSYKHALTSDSDSDEDDHRDKGHATRPDWRKLRGIISDDGDSN